MTEASSVREATEAILGTSIKDPYSEICSHAFCALALCAVGESARAAPLATRGRELLESAFLRPPFLDVALVAECTALIASVGTADIELARRAMKRLRGRQHRVAGIRVATRVLSARLAIREGRADAARRELASVVEDLPRHGEPWRVYEAHTLLASLLAGSDAPAARAHTALAHELAETLLISLDVPDDQTDAAPLTQPKARSSRTTLNSLWNAVVPTLPPGLRLAIAEVPLVVVQGDPALLELLLVNLVLTARDASSRDGDIVIESRLTHLTQEQMSKQHTSIAQWGCVEVRVGHTGVVSPRSGLRECHAICGDLGGFMEVSETATDLLLRAYLPAIDTVATAPMELAVVVHRDDLLRRGLVDGLRRAGWTVVEVPAGEQWPADATLALVDGRFASTLPPAGNTTVVHVISRSDPTPDAPFLRVPYLVRELEDLLVRLKRVPSAAGSPSA
jgi:hypothetical protein